MLTQITPGQLESFKFMNQDSNFMVWFAFRFHLTFKNIIATFMKARRLLLHVE